MTIRRRSCLLCAVSARSTQQLSAHHREVAGLGQTDGTRWIGAIRERQLPSSTSWQGK
jgi:hypothetical protein